MSKLMDIIFICSSIIFNISVSVFYIAVKLGNMVCAARMRARIQ